MPKCEHRSISTHGRCLICNAQVFTSKVLKKAGIPEFCVVARRFGMLRDPGYAEIERRKHA